MKNITALTVLVIIILSFFNVFTAHCQEKENERNYGFSFGTQFGFIHGKALEYVYSQPGETASDILSELTWEMKPVFYYGLQLDFGYVNIMKGPGFFASVSIKAGVLGDSGFLEDRDWMSAENTDLTHFSRHTNKTSEYYSLDAVVGASIPIWQIYLKPFISGSWMHFSFAGRDGYVKYAREKSFDIFGNPVSYYPIDDNPREGTLSGDVIRYQQNWYLLAAGVSVGTKILHPFSFELSFQISPLTYCAAIDNHLDKSKTIDYYDFTSWGLFLEPSANVSFTYEKIEFLFETSFRYIGRTIGESYTGINDSVFLNGQAGAGLSFLDSRLLVKFHIF